MKCSVCPNKLTYKYIHNGKVYCYPHWIALQTPVTYWETHS